MSSPLQYLMPQYLKLVRSGLSLEHCKTQIFFIKTILLLSYLYALDHFLIESSNLCQCSGHKLPQIFM